jgi:hypothetical protein
MTTGNVELAKKKYHALASVAAFISVVIVGAIAVALGPLLIVALIVYRCLFPKQEDINRELKDKQWEMRHAMLMSQQ